MEKKLVIKSYEGDIHHIVYLNDFVRAVVPTNHDGLKCVLITLKHNISFYVCTEESYSLMKAINKFVSDDESELTVILPKTEVKNVLEL